MVLMIIGKSCVLLADERQKQVWSCRQSGADSCRRRWSCCEWQRCVVNKWMRVAKLGMNEKCIYVPSTLGQPRSHIRSCTAE